MEKIYILHEYYTPSHFNALYKEANRNGYKIESYIIMSRINVIKKTIKDIIKTKNIIKPIKNYLKNEKNLMSLKKLDRSILIVGIAPYNKLIKKYNNIFKNNHTIYFTSWTYWDDANKKVHDGINRSEYINILNECTKGVACVSSKTEQTIKTVLNENIKTSEVKHSIDIENYRIKEQLDKCKFDQNIRKFIFLGQLIARKNVDLLIEWIKQSNEKFEFYFAGNGELKSEILNLCEIDSRVKYIGFLTKEEIRNTLKNYDFMVLPSKDEPYGIVLIEALSAGVPCIVSNAIGPSEIIENDRNGFVINDIDDINLLDKYLSKAINIEYSDYKTMSKNCIKDSRRYSTESVMKQWIKLLKV